MAAVRERLRARAGDARAQLGSAGAAPARAGGRSIHREVPEGQTPGAHSPGHLLLKYLPVAHRRRGVAADGLWVCFFLTRLWLILGHSLTVVKLDVRESCAPRRATICFCRKPT